MAAISINCAIETVLFVTNTIRIKTNTIKIKTNRTIFVTNLIIFKTNRINFVGSQTIDIYEDAASSDFSDKFRHVSHIFRHVSDNVRHVSDNVRHVSDNVHHVSGNVRHLFNFINHKSNYKNDGSNNLDNKYYRNRSINYPLCLQNNLNRDGIDCLPPGTAFLHHGENGRHLAGRSYLTINP